MEQATAAKPLGATYLHSTMTRSPSGRDVVIVSENLYMSDKSVVPNLRIIDDPKRTIYITKPQFRTHTEKKEIEHVSKLDAVRVSNSEMITDIYRALYNKYPKGYIRPSVVLDSPYVYGAGIEMEALVKMKYKRDFAKTGLVQIAPTTGFLDMEWDIDTGEISLISCTHENKLYTAINKKFFYDEDDDGNRTPGDLAKVDALSKRTIQMLVDEVIMKDSKNKKLLLHKLPFETFYFVGDNDLKMIQWIFEQIHMNKTSFVGIWNIDADIPQILARLAYYGVNPEEIFCHPDIPLAYRSFRYKEDKKQGHFSEKWHWVYCTGYSQFIDSMCLYARLRVVSGKETYGLDAVLKKNGLEGKLYFPELDKTKSITSKTQWHKVMTKSFFNYYTVYNQADVFLIQLMEWKNRDAQGMTMLADVTPLHKFPRQSKGVENVLYSDWQPKGYILGTTGSNMVSEYDGEIGAVGGAVLSPKRMESRGMAIFHEYPSHRTQINCCVNDIDFTGMYPNTAQAGNVSKETKLSTALYIYAPHVQVHYDPRRATEIFFGYIINPKDNAMRLGTEFFNLPDFKSMEQRVKEKLGRG